MKHFGKLAVLGAVLAASAQFASATPINGTLAATDFGGSFNGSSITFGTSGIVSGVAGSSFAPFTLGNAVTFQAGPFAYGAASTTTTVPGSGATTGGVLIATTSEAGEVLQYFVTSETTLFDTTSSYLDLAGTGYFQEAGVTNYSPTAASFTLTGSSSNSVFQIGGTASTIAPTPEPSSLMLLGTGLVSAAGAFLRKRVTA